MTALTQLKKLSGAIALIAVTVSCGDVVRQGRSPVYLVVDQLTGTSGASASAGNGNTLQSDVITMVTTPAPCTQTAPCPTVFSDSGAIALRALQKDVSATAPSSNSEVTINRYHIDYRRADGRNTPGVDVPYAFDGAATGTTVGGKLNLTFELVRHVAKEESPLVELGSNAAVITTIAEVTFYGRDQVGNDISVSGTMQIDFGNFGDK
jgi:hypothetical protein